jgi:NAD(P) transhydrogenase
VVRAERAKEEQNLAAHEITLLRGTASFHDPHTIAVTAADGDVQQIKAGYVLIATGSRPHRPPEIPFDDKLVFDSDSILQMDRIPQSMAVVGGGVIGCEYASIFTALGVQVSLIDGRDRLLPFLDAEISESLRQQLTALGMAFYAKERLADCVPVVERVRLRLHSSRAIDADTVLFAAGRRGAVDGLALEKAGLALNDRGYMAVDASYRTAVPHIYAAGDVIGFPALASTSMEQGRVAVCHAFGFSYKQRLANQLPMGIYTIPEISAVGESEESCREQKIPYEVGRARYCNNARGQIAGDTRGLLKLIFHRETRCLLGVHIIGENATELVHLGMSVLESGGKLDTFIELVFNYPTLSEMYKYAAYDGLGNLAGRKMREG